MVDRYLVHVHYIIGKYWEQKFRLTSIGNKCCMRSYKAQYHLILSSIKKTRYNYDI